MTKYYPSFKAIVKGDILAVNNPFRYVYSEHDAYFWDGDTLMLEDVDVPRFIGGDSGDFQLIVKPDWEVRLRVKTENWGAFQNGLGALSNSTLKAYDIDIDDEFFSSFGWKSSFEVTLRGDAMFGIWIDGHERNEVWGRGAFDDEVRIRLSEPKIPNYGAAPSGMLMSLTHPNGNYDTQETYTIKMEELNDETALEILWVRRLDDVNTRPVNTDSESTPKYDYTNMSDFVVVGSGTNTDTGLSYSVKVGTLTTPTMTTYWVFNNGEALDFYTTKAEAMKRAERELSRAQATAADPPFDKDPTPTNPVWNEITDVGVTASIGAGLLLGAVILILLLRRG